MIPRLSLTPYRLPLRRAWRSARGARAERTGWLVRARLNGIEGFGDCSPLPEAGTETAELAGERLLLWSRRYGALSVHDQLALLADSAETRTPAADASIETALLDLDARWRGQSLRARLSGADADASQEITVNAALGAVTSVSPGAVESALNAGFDTLKLKVGVATPAEELATIAALCRGLPARVRLRLDANRAWSEADARRMVAGLVRWADRIDSLEEPLREPSDRALQALQQQAPFAIALDESLQFRPWPISLEALPVRRLVLKPAVIGGLRPTLNLARSALGRGGEVVITSLIESAAGIWASVQLAAATGSTAAHGLATSDWLATDLGPAPAIESGRIRLPDRPGSGFDPQ